MHLLTDEGIHRIVVDRLRAAGYDVEWVKRSCPGTSDADILGRPDIDASVFITNDRDFGELIFRDRLPAPHAIFYSRLPHREPHLLADRRIALLARGSRPRHLVTIARNGERSKPLPSGVPHA